MEKETSRRPAWKVDVHVGRWRVFAHKNGPAEDSERKMGTKQLGDDRGGPVSQERR